MNLVHIVIEILKIIYKSFVFIKKFYKKDMLII